MTPAWRTFPFLSVFSFHCRDLLLLTLSVLIQAKKKSDEHRHRCSRPVQLIHIAQQSERRLIYLRVWVIIVEVIVTGNNHARDRDRD